VVCRFDPGIPRVCSWSAGSTPGYGPAQTTEPPGQKPLVVNGVVVGPFEEEEEGTGIGSVKVQGEDPAIPGPLT